MPRDSSVDSSVLPDYAGRYQQERRGYDHMKNSTSEREEIGALEWFQKASATTFENKGSIMKGFSKASAIAARG